MGSDHDIFTGCAIVWTRSKVCRKRGWQLTQPQVPHRLAREWGRMIEAGYEPAVTLRTSGLIGFEADGDEDSARLERALHARSVRPWLVEGRQADDGRRLDLFAREQLDRLAEGYGPQVIGNVRILNRLLGSLEDRLDGLLIGQRGLERSICCRGAAGAWRATTRARWAVWPPPPAGSTVCRSRVFR